MTVEELLALAPGFVDPDRAKGKDAVADLVVDDERHQFVLRDGRLTVTRDGAEAATLTVHATAADLFAVSRGEAHPVRLFAAGRLRASGDLLLALRLRGVFRIPPGYG